MSPDPLPPPIPFLGARRALFAALVLGTTAAGGALMVDILRADGISLLEVGILVLFVLTFGWISVSFWNGVLGFLLLLFRRDPLTLERTLTGEGEPGAPIRGRCALVMPVHNEDPELVAPGVQAILDSVAATGQSRAFDFHLLSDTTDPEIARREEELWGGLRRGRPGGDGGPEIHYRRRRSNAGRKAGNVAEFCRRRGREYEYMVVLDADSVMTGETLVALVRAMEANPRAGIIQTVPLPAGQTTHFSRLVQFAASLHAPILASGMAFWQGDTANYWGHNAILRMEPFLDHGKLPLLPGSPPWGGEILSHDFVEAALLRRGGWQVLLLPLLKGSSEGVPTAIPAFARRDRRWAQGSLQHLRLLAMPGLHPLSRLHFLLGAMGYISSLLWLLMLLAATAYVALPGLSSPPLVPPGHPILMGWPITRSGWVISLLLATALLLFLPKLLALGLALLRERGRFGGGLRLAAGAAAELLFSVVTAPVMMLLHSRAVVSIAAGRTVAWDAHPRTGELLGWREAWRAGGWITGIGVAWSAGTLALSPLFFLWLTPIFCGLLLSVPLIRWSSGPSSPGSPGEPRFLGVPGEIVRRPAAAPPSSLDPTASHRGSRSRTFPPKEGRGGAAAPPCPRLEPQDRAMYEAERALFELRRGRPLLVTASPVVPGVENSLEAGVLLATVEGLRPETLRELSRMGSAPPRLVITRHRALAMGLARENGAGHLAAGGYSLGLNGYPGPEWILELSSSPDAPGPSPGEVRPASPEEVAGLTLARLGRLLPAVVAVPVEGEGNAGLWSALDSRELLAVETGEIAAMAGAPRVEVSYVSDAPVPLEEAEDARFILFREANGLLEHVAILIGERGSWPDPVPVRLHSACLTGDLFGSLRCDCGEQLRGSLRLFADAGGGVLLYLAQEGRGIGLGNKLRAYGLQESKGLDTVDADCALGFGADERGYDAAVEMLRHLQIQRIQLVTNNPEKLRALQEGGIQVVDRRPLHGTLNRHNLPYVRAKVHRAGHWLEGMLGGGGPGG